MSQGDLRKHYCVVALMGLILLGVLAIAAGPASAEMMQYTYIGNQFTNVDEGNPSDGFYPFPDSSVPVGHVTVSFIYDGDLNTGTLVGPVTLSCGDVTIVSSMSDPILGIFAIQAVGSDGLPAQWSISSRQDEYYGYDIRTSTGIDFVEYRIGKGVVPFPYASTNDIGVWVATPAPVPPTVLLFGSGLLGLAGWRRFRKG